MTKRWVLLVVGATRPLPRDGGAEELHGSPTVGPCPKVWSKMEAAPKMARRRCSDAGQSRRRQDPVDDVRSAARIILLPFYPA